jgi:hypothetical protein
MIARKRCGTRVQNLGSMRAGKNEQTPVNVSEPWSKQCVRNPSPRNFLIHSHHKSVAEVAQLVEHSPEKAGVDSSILSLGTIFPITYATV